VSNNSFANGVIEMVIITKTMPDLFFSFMDVVSSIQPCNLQRIRQGLKTAMGPVYSVQNFATQYGLVTYDKTTSSLSLSPEGERLMYYTGNLRNKFLIENLKLQFCEPFASLRHELSKKTQMTIKDLGDFLEMKFPQRRKWSVEDKIDYSEAVAEWLILLQIAKREDKKIEYLGGEVKTAGIIYYADMGKLLDRTIYDFLTEQFHTPKNMTDEPYELLGKTNQAKDDNEKGELFESFISCIFRRFGFSSRLKDGAREKSTNLTFEKSGGGDVALFCHFPIQSQNEILRGCAIACEAKATGNVVGSKAVGQVRNFSKKIRENCPQYLVQPLILSQSTFGYDESGRRNAPPEVVHMTAKLVLSLLEIQRKRLEQGLSLITPIHIVLLLENLVKRETLQPDEKTVIEIIDNLVSA
jgi:hypothetical protein